MSLIFMIVSCHKVATSSSDTSSHDEPNKPDTSELLVEGLCAEGDTLCLSNSVYMCDSGEWQEVDNCDANNRTCVQHNGGYGCSSLLDSSADEDIENRSDTESDTSSDCYTTDNDIACDGASVDCYEECWDCALHADCQPTLDDCLTDTDSGGCAIYYTCKENNCCDGENGCLEGDEWMACMSQCRSDNGISPLAIDLYDAIDKCVACDACAISCGQNLSGDWLICQDGNEINIPTNPCYEDEVEEGETACFSWAGWGGPCTDATAACMNDATCIELENCFVESWNHDDWTLIQEQCLTDHAAAEELYWDFQQCIYCDACDLACAGDAGSRRCEEYDGKKKLDYQY